MRKKSPDDFRGKNPSHNFFYRYVVAGLNKAKKMPVPPGMSPQGTVDLDQAARAWESSRSDLYGFLEKIESAGAVVQKYFPFGALSAADLMTMNEAHMHYHETRLTGS